MKFVHLDRWDASLSFSVVVQPGNPPPQNKAMWYSADGTMTPLTDAVVEVCAVSLYQPSVLLRSCAMQVYDGLCCPHGIMPPLEYNPEFPWYSMTMVMKGSDEDYLVICFCGSAGNNVRCSRRHTTAVRSGSRQLSPGTQGSAHAASPYANISKSTGGPGKITTSFWLCICRLGPILTLYNTF